MNHSVPAKEALGTALYSSGYFEKALIQFHKSNRLRQSSCYDEWIGRCEETIRAYLTAADIDAGTVQGGNLIRDILKILCSLIPDILINPEYHNWMDVINLHKDQEQVKIQEKENRPESLFSETSEEEIHLQEIKKKNNRKKTGLLMGKLHDDMMFLDKIANHPALQKNILILKEEEINGKASSRDIDKV